MIQEKRLLDEFFELLRMYTPTLGEREIADLLTKRLEGLGFTVVEDDGGAKLGGTAGNLVATRKGTVPEAPMIMLTAHMDTVQPCKDVQPQLKDGLITSDGTTVLGADDKVGIATILEALRTIDEQKIPHGDLQIVFNIAEEGGVNGSRVMNSSLLKAQYGFVFDTINSPGRIVRKAPGKNRIEARIIGKSAHAGNSPEKGISAIVVAANIITKLPQGRIDEETTANIGIIHGGRETNVVPEETTIVMETRSRDKEKLTELTDNAVRTFELVAREMGATAEVTVIKNYSPFKLAENHETVQLAKRACENLEFPINITEGGGGSDACFFNAYGVPSVVLGVGIRNPHSKEEYIPEKDLYDTARLAVELIKEAAKLKA